MGFDISNCVMLMVTLDIEEYGVGFFVFQALSDDEKRKVYDAHGEEGLKKMSGENGHDPFDSFNR